MSHTFTAANGPACMIAIAGAWRIDYRQGSSQSGQTLSQLSVTKLLIDSDPWPQVESCAQGVPGLNY
jgi:hypothetical protein